MEQARISTPQGTSSAQAARTRAPAQQKGVTDEGAAAQPGSFLSLLAAQDPELAEGGDPLAAMPEATDAASVLAQTVDPTTLVGWQALVAGDSAAQQSKGLPGADGLTTVGLGQRGAPGALPADMVGLADSAAALSGRLLAAQGLSTTDGLVSQTAALDGGAQDGLPQPTATLGFGRQFSRMHSAALQRGVSDAALGGAGGAAEAWSARSAVGGDAKQAGAASSADLSALSTTVGASVRDQLGGTGLHRSAGESAGAGIDAPLLAGQDPLAAVGATGARSADAGGGESSRHGGSGGLGEGGAEPSFAVDGAPGTAGFEELAQTGAEELLAEQVTYWANQKTQNAELTLTRDGQPLAVTVALSGNEAHVTFRSDQEHTREMLDQSMAQLSELLRGEGLVLSGMTVGTSAGQGAMAGDAGQQRNRSGEGQQAQVLASGPTDVSQRLAGSGTRNGAVDVFV